MSTYCWVTDRLTQGLNSVLNVKALYVYSRPFQPGEGPNMGLLHDYEPSDGPSFAALVSSV